VGEALMLSVPVIVLNDMPQAILSLVVNSLVSAV
jgi:hypothetical protein